MNEDGIEKLGAIKTVYGIGLMASKALREEIKRKPIRTTLKMAFPFLIVGSTIAGARTTRAAFDDTMSRADEHYQSPSQMLGVYRNPGGYIDSIAVQRNDEYYVVRRTPIERLELEITAARYQRIQK